MQQGSYTRYVCGQALIWLGRVASLASVAYLLWLIWGRVDHFFDARPMQQASFVLFPLLVMLGLALTWVWEGFGSALALTGLLAFYLLHYLNKAVWPTGWNYLLYTAPALIVFAGWVIRNRGAYRCPH